MVPGGPTGPCEPVQGRKGALASSTHVWPVYGHSSGNRSGGLGLLGRSHAKPRRHPSPPPKAPRSNPAGIPRGSLKKRNFKKRKRRFGEAFPSLALFEVALFSQLGLHANGEETRLPWSDRCNGRRTARFSPTEKESRP